jgi:hypothetical protein
MVLASAGAVPTVAKATSESACRSSDQTLLVASGQNESAPETGALPNFNQSLYQNQIQQPGSDNLFGSELEPWVFFWAMPAGLQFLRIVVWLARNKTPGVKLSSCSLYQ